MEDEPGGIELEWEPRPAWLPGLHCRAEPPSSSAPATSHPQGAGEATPLLDPRHTLEVTLWHECEGPSSPA